MYPVFQNTKLGFQVRVLSQTTNPQTLVYLALHQDYLSDFVGSEKELAKTPSETSCGNLAIKRLLEGNKGHFGCLEHPSITFACGFINHGTMQQLRTHRIGVSFDCQSMRYTYENLLKAAKGQIDVEDVIYFRPVGKYSDRQGNKINYDTTLRLQDIYLAAQLVQHYSDRVENQNFPPEFARGLLPFDYRQHFVFTSNLRSLMHIFDLRAKKNAQGEIVELCNLLFEPFKLWCPEIADWYEKNRFGKALLSP
jgi:thymidylate synthase (FAD)